MAENYPVARQRLGALVGPAIAAVTGSEQRSLENPSTPLSAPDDWLYDALGSYRASSGVNVNTQTALTYAGVWRAVNLISGDVGRLPLHLYRRLDRGRERAMDRALYRILRYKPNSEMTAMVWRKTAQAHVLLTGNSYSYISRAGSGRVLELIPINPTQCYPVRRDGKLWYLIDIPNLDMRRVDPRDMFHIKGLSYDGLLGYSVIAKARESLGLGMALQTYSSVFFRNNGSPHIALEYPEGMKPEAVQTLRENWERLHSGLENAHRVALLKGGVKLHTYSINAKDAQLIDSRKFEIGEVANWFSVPKHKLGDDSKSSYNSLEQENQQYLDEGLEPWLCTWEEEIWDKLLSEKEQDDYFAEFDRRGLLRANLAARGVYYQQAVAGGWMTPNQVREQEGENPREDPAGDQYARPLNMEYVGGQTDDDEDDSPAAQDDPGALLLSVPDIRQADTYSCGAACAMAVGQYFGVGPATLEEWKTALGTSARDSTRPFAIAQYLAELGLAVTAASDLSIEDLQACWKRGAPVICPIQEYGVPSKQASFKYGHYVIVIGAALGHVFVQDPSIDNVLEGEDADQAPGRMLITEEDFLAAWRDEDADGKPYVRFGIAVAKELPPPPEPPPPPAPTTAPAAPPAKPAPAKKPTTKKKPSAEQKARRARLIELHAKLIADAAARMCKRLTVHARKAAKQKDEFERFLRSLAKEHGAVIHEALAPVIDAGGVLAGHRVGAEPIIGALVGGFALRCHAAYAQGLAALDAELTEFERATPADLADRVLERAKPDKASRTTDEAMDILNRLPDAEKDGHVALTMPVDEKPPYEGKVKVGDLADIKTKAVKIRKLIGTRISVERKRVADFVKNPDAYTKGRELASLPTDRPYVIKSDGKLYIYDGHHRLMARQLLGTVKTKVYFYEVQ